MESYTPTILVEDCFSNLVNEPGITIMRNPQKLVKWCEVRMACISFTKEANGTSSSLGSKQPETKYMEQFVLDSSQSNNASLKSNKKGVSLDKGLL